MTASGFFSAILVGLIIGVLARVVVRNSEPIGCLLTVLIGVVGGAIGAAVGSWQSWGFWLTFAVQIVVSAVIVAVFSAATRRR